MDVSGVTDTTVEVIASWAVRASGFWPVATTRQVMSRSVIIPIGIFESSASTTGMHPQSWSTIILATSCSPVSGVQHAGYSVIISRTFIIQTPWLLNPPEGRYFPYRRRSLRGDLKL